MLGSDDMLSMEKAVVTAAESCCKLQMQAADSMILSQAKRLAIESWLSSVVNLGSHRQNKRCNSKLDKTAAQSYAKESRKAHLLNAKDSSTCRTAESKYSLYSLLLLTRTANVLSTRSNTRY